MLHLRVWLPFIVLLQNKHTTLAENVENLISAHLKLAPTLKVQKFNKRLGRLSESIRYMLQLIFISDNFYFFFCFNFLAYSTWVKKINYNKYKLQVY